MHVCRDMEWLWKDQMLMVIVDWWHLGCSCPSFLHTLNCLNCYSEHVVILTKQ